MIDKTTLKARVIKNIRYIIDHSNFKIGDIEREAGLSLGYLSRKEGEIENEASEGVTLQFLYVFAKKVGIGIDILTDYDIYLELENKLQGVKVLRDIQKLIMEISDLRDRVDNAHVLDAIESASSSLSKALRVQEYQTSKQDTTLPEQVVEQLLEISSIVSQR